MFIAFVLDEKQGLKFAVSRSSFLSVSNIWCAVTVQLQMALYLLAVTGLMHSELSITFALSYVKTEPYALEYLLCIQRLQY